MATKSKRKDNFSLKDFKGETRIRHNAIVESIYKPLLALLCGLLLALGSPGIDQCWVNWVMVAPFLVLLNLCYGHVEVLLCGLFFGLGYHLLTLHAYLGMLPVNGLQGLSYWQANLTIWFLQSLELSLSTVAFSWLVRFLPLRPGYVPFFRRPFFPYLIAVPLIWLFTHWGLTIARPLDNLWQFLPLPPLLIDELCYSQYNQPALLQICQYFGPSGIDFLILLVNAAIAAVLMEFIKTQGGPVERVDLISPKWGAFLDLVIALLILGSAYWWGEGQLKNSVINKSVADENYSLNSEARQPLIPILIAGNDQLDSCTKSTPLPLFVTPGKIIENNTVTKKEVHAFPLEPFESYKAKTGLLQLSMPITLKEWFLSSKANDITDMKSKLIRLGWGKVGLLNNAEIIRPAVVADRVRQGASVILSYGNLAWTKSRYIAKQLIAVAVLRAAENKRYVVLAYRSGPLAVIEPSGVIQSVFLEADKNTANDGKPMAILGNVQFLWSKTAFSKMWWL